MTEEIQKLLNKNNGKLPSISTVGIHNLYYMINTGNTVCPECANESIVNDNEYTIVSQHINWEDKYLSCVCCNRLIPILQEATQ